MSEDKRMDAVELVEEKLDKVDGGLKVDNLVLDNKSKRSAAKKMPTDGKTFTVKSALATGETIAVPMDTQNDEKETGKRIPKVVFREKGTSI